MRPQSAIVVGAGIGGLAAACALVQRGWQVRVLERAKMLAEIGAGLTLSPNAMRSVTALGIEPQLRPWLSLPPYQISEDPLSGAETNRLVRGESALQQYGAPYAFVHRADLHNTLRQHLQSLSPDALLLGHDCESAVSGETSATVRCSGNRLFDADLIIGADGVRSIVRSALLGADAARYTGFVAWRALLPLDVVPAGSAPAGSAICFGIGKCFVRYLIEPRGLLNVVAFARQNNWVEESWSVPADSATPAALFADWHPALSALWRIVPRSTCFQWGLFDRDPIDSYAFGRVALLGDAAHPMLPFLGQGAALALEDAVVLARALDVDADVPEALARYNAVRQPRGRAAQLESRAAGQRLHGDGGDPREINEETLDYFCYDPLAVPL
jgi:salicylate hydroxylase